MRDADRGATEPLRILMTADAAGGVWTYALELCGALRCWNCTVVLAVMGPEPGAERRAEAAALGNVTLRVSDFRLEWMDEPWEDVAAAGDWLLKLEKEFRPDIVHLNGYVHGALDWSAPTVVAAHACVLSRWEAVNGVPAPRCWNRYAEEAGRGLRAARWVVAPTRGMLADVVRHYGPLDNASTIHNARSPHAFFAGCKRPYVMTAGRAGDEAKNAAALQRAAPRLPWPVYAAGDGCEAGAGELQTSCEESDFQRLGRLSNQEFARWLSAASVYALPARYEPFGLSILEAALAECALVLGDIATLRELWEGAAFFVSPDDDGALEDAIQTLIRDPGMRAARAAAARERALSYAPSAMAREYMRGYQSLLPGSGVAGSGGRAARREAVSS